MYRWLTKSWWFAAMFAVLLVGGSVALVSQQQQSDARDRLTLLRIANDNLELVTQARLDEALGQKSLAFTPSETEDVMQHADYLRSLTDRAEPGLTQWRERLDEAVEYADGRDLMSVSLALDQLESATMSPVHAEQRAAAARVLWSLLATGALLAALLVIELRRPDEQTRR